MRILLTNDDGINAIGINALVNALKGRHEITVVAPKSQRSASAHSITLHKAIEYKELPSEKNVKFYSVDGTPADCVKLAALHLLGATLPDLVISGINEGENLGSDTLYSGTVSAAFEANYLGMRAIAVSLYYWKEKYDMGGYDRAAQFIADNLDNLVAFNIDKYSILNINHPDGESAGVVAAPIGVSYYTDRYAIVDEAVPERLRLLGEPLLPSETDLHSDVAWARKNYTVISPLKLDRNDYDTLEMLKKWGWGK